MSSTADTVPKLHTHAIAPALATKTISQNIYILGQGVQTLFLDFGVDCL